MPVEQLSDLEFSHSLERAHRLIAEGKHLHAMQVLFRLVREFPDKEAGTITLAGLLERQGNIPGAIDAIKATIDTAPQNIQLRLYAGHFFFKQQMWQETIDVLSVVVPENEPLCAFFCGYSYFMLKDYPLAKHFYMIYLNNHRSADFVQDAYVYLCKICIHLEEFTEALEYIQKAAEYFAGHYELHQLFAIVYFYLGMSTHALESIEQAIALNPADASLYEWAGKICIQCQRFDKAEQYLTHFSGSSDAISAEAYAHLGIACLYNRKAPDAKRYFEQALAINPTETTALAGLKKMNTEHYLYE